MQNLDLQATSTTPAIEFNAASGLLSISGRCIHENPPQMFQVINDWLKEYVQLPRPFTVLRINLEYFNTSSSKCILDFLKTLKKIEDTGNHLEVIWIYHEDDEDMKQTGEDFSELTDIPFEYVEYD